MQYSGSESGEGEAVKIESNLVPKCDKFHYWGDIVEQNRQFEFYFGKRSCTMRE